MTDDRATQFTSLYTQHERQIFRLVASLLPHAADADDVVQETARKLWSEFDNYDQERPFLPWACTLARFEVLSFLKRRKVQRKYFTADVVELLAIDWGERDEIREEQMVALRFCVQQLRSSDRDLLLDRYEGESMKQLAEQNGCTPNSLYKTLQRIREALFQCVSRKLSGQES